MGTQDSEDRLTLRQAARLITGGTPAIRSAELSLIHAIEHGELPANIKRWGTEQWDGNGLPGNISEDETLIERADLEAWQTRRAAR